MIKKLLIFIPISFAMSSSYATGKEIEQGYRYETYLINQHLKKNESSLSEQYDFAQYAENGIVPPSVICYNDFGNIKEEIKVVHGNVPVSSCKIIHKAVKLSDDKYKNETLWKEYLDMPESEDGDNMEVKAVMSEDFEIGRDEAFRLYAIQLKKLNAAYFGMRSYKFLETKGLVEKLDIK